MIAIRGSGFGTWLAWLGMWGGGLLAALWANEQGNRGLGQRGILEILLPGFAHGSEMGPPGYRRWSARSAKRHPGPHSPSLCLVFGTRKVLGERRGMLTLDESLPCPRYISTVIAHHLVDRGLSFWAVEIRIECPLP